MQDESLIDEMRQTIQADRDRALARRRERPEPPPAETVVSAPEPAARRPGLLARLVRQKPPA